MSEQEKTFSVPYPAIDPLECKACGRCIAACPKKVLHMGRTLNARGYVYAEYAGAAPDRPAGGGGRESD